MQTVTIGKTTYKTNRTDIFAHHAKCTGKHKPVKSKGAEKRLYPPFGASMSTAEYVAAYESMNSSRCIGSWDWQPLSTAPTMVSGEDAAWGGDRMKHYYFYIPQWIHRVVTMHGYDKKDAVKRFKHLHGMTKMPRGYKVWEANHESI